MGHWLAGAVKRALGWEAFPGIPIFQGWPSQVVISMSCQQGDSLHVYQLLQAKEHCNVQAVVAGHVIGTTRVKTAPWHTNRAL